MHYGIQLQQQILNSIIIDKNTLRYDEYLLLIAQCETIISDESYSFKDYYSGYSIDNAQPILYEQLKDNILSIIQKNNR